MSNDIAINKARAVYYNLFSKFFVYPKDMDKYKELLNILSFIKQAPLDSNCEEALSNLELKLPKDSNELLISEFDELFSNPNFLVVKSTASFYDEGIENGNKRLEMLQFLAKTTIRRDEKSYFENEDNIGFIVTILFELLESFNNGEAKYENTIHCIFEQILNSFVDEFNEELYNHEKSDIYKEVAVLFSSFIAFERLCLNVAKPPKKEKIENKSNSLISDEEKERRAKNKALKAQGAKGGEINHQIDDVNCCM